MKKTTHTKAKHFAAAALIIVPLLTPVIAAAQTTTDITNLYQDGSTESRTAWRERVRGYRQQSSEIQQKIAALPTTASPVVFMPVLFGIGVKDIFPNFGDPRSGGRTHEGEDIMAVKGTPIVSPTPAVVLRVGTGTTEGYYVYTANPGGETFVYMHLDRIGEGVVPGLVLAQGQLIGYVGNTGNASGGAAHLHFEIHDSSDNPTNPFPRLSAEISIAEKISYLTTILAQNSDSNALATLLVTHFRGTFVAALAAGITLPVQITNALASIPAGTPTTGRVTLPAGDMDIGSSGAAVVSLQQYLIASAKGAAAIRLAGAGATGNFGTMTKAALLEFQVAVGISPANGYYGPVTAAFIGTHPITVTTPPINPIALSRDLKLGMVGEDVRTLQKILNTKGYTVATTGAGSLGSETTYFGPATQAAVIRFQIARNISPTAGYVGALTRAALAIL